MSEIALRNVCKQFDSEHYGVKDFNLDIHDKEFVIFVGPSGCGKSTTLRIIAGLEEITDGELWIDGELSNYLEPKERGMSMVFQNYALYPNMTVYGNMAYALKIRKMPKDEIDKKVHEVAKILEIEQLLEKEKQAEETKNELITNIAHDLRTPLTSILGYLDILSTRKDLPEETRQNYIRIAHDKAKHLQQMIEDLFGFTKLSYSKQTTNMQPIDIITLLAQLLDEFYPVFENNEMDYEYHPDVSNFVIQGDATLLVRLFDNLINNAIKYGKEGKLLIVKTRTQKEAITVDIINFGKVIPQKDLDRVFEKFYRAESSRNSATGGTGLGLAIAANVARIHGGSIAAKSSLEGTVFSVMLPSTHEENIEDDNHAKQEVSDES